MQLAKKLKKKRKALPAGQVVNVLLSPLPQRLHMYATQLSNVTIADPGCRHRAAGKWHAQAKEGQESQKGPCTAYSSCRGSSRWGHARGTCRGQQHTRLLVWNSCWHFPPEPQCVDMLQAIEQPEDAVEAAGPDVAAAVAAAAAASNVSGIMSSAEFTSLDLTELTHQAGGAQTTASCPQSLV